MDQFRPDLLCFFYYDLRHPKKNGLQATTKKLRPYESLENIKNHFLWKILEFMDSIYGQYMVTHFQISQSIMI